MKGWDYMLHPDDLEDKATSIKHDLMMAIMIIGIMCGIFCIPIAIFLKELFKC